ncbi:hypothetical protein KPL71_023616 [Citrus sinensis]|uniref:Uncharacterized protein n=2 Tax=Citrus sinensis TaxID=2711 RepID=A0ACB8IKF7_CITSI|nr:hypothetical protein KPL71_023616 [Citrus sinensis]
MTSGSAQQARPRAEKSRSSRAPARGSFTRHHRAQQARPRAAPSRAASAPARGTIARSKRASARHHRAQLARLRAAPSRGTIARSKRASARHHRAQQAPSRAASAPARGTIARHHRAAPSRALARLRAAPSRAASAPARGTIARSQRYRARHHRAQQAPQRAAPSRAAGAIGRGTISRNHRAQLARLRAPPLRALSEIPAAPSRGTIVRYLRARARHHTAQLARLRAAPSRPSARHHRAQQAHQRAAPSRAVSEIARGPIARSNRASARHHRAAPSRTASAPARRTIARSKRTSARHHRANQRDSEGHHRAQQARQRAAPSRAVSEIARGSFTQHHRAQQARQRAAPSRAASAPARGTIASSKRARARHHRAQRAPQRAAPSRAASSPARGTIARSKRTSARHHRAQAANSRAARQPTLARQGCPRSSGKAAHCGARLRTLAREAADARAARKPTLAREAAHFRVRHASPTREEGSANSCEGCSPASRARSARSRGRIRARARHAPGTRAANCRRSSEARQRALATKARSRRSSEARQRALATKARSRRSSEARQRALATKARSPRSSEARLAHAMQPPLARQAAQAREASCPRSRGQAARACEQARHDRAARTAPSRATHSTLARGRPRSPWLGRVASFRAGSLCAFVNRRRRRKSIPSKATLPLTIPRRVFKSSAKDSTRRSMGITIQGGRRGPSAAGAWPTTRASGDRAVPTAGRQTGGGRTRRSSPDSDLEAFSHNPAHGSFAPLAFQPSAMTNCANQRSKGSIGHAFTVRIRTENQNQTSFYPFVPHEISVLVELILGHLRYLLTDVPPQPNSPPDNVFRPDRPPRIPLVRTSSESTVRRPGKAPERTVPSPSPGRHAATRSRRGGSSSSPPTADGFGTGTPVPSPQSQSFSRSYGSILPTSLAYIVPSTRGCSPWRPDAVMSTTGRGRHSVLRIFKGRRGRTGHRATCGALPAAGPYLRLSRFQDLHRRPLRPGSRPGFCGDRRALLLIGAWHLPRRPGIGRALKRHPFSGLVDSADERFARQYRCGPPPEFPLASPRSGIVHHLSGPDRHAHTRTLLRRSRSVGGAPARDPANQLPCALRVYWPVDSHTCQTPWSVFQDGPNGEPAGRCRERAGTRSTPGGRALPATIAATTSPQAYRRPGLGPPPQSASVRAPSRSADRLSPFRIRPGRIAGPHPLPSRQFQALFDSLFKVLFIFPSRYLFAIGLSPVFSLGRNLPPDLGCIPKQPDSQTAPRGATGSGRDGALTLSGAPFQGTWARSAAEDASPDYNSDAGGARFSSWALPGSLAVTKGILRRLRGASGSQSPHLETGRAAGAREALFHHRSPRLRSPRTHIWANREQSAHGRPISARTPGPPPWFGGVGLDGSRDSAIHTKYRISLRSSSMREPRYPLPRVSAPGVRCFASRERDESLSPRRGAGRRSARCGRIPPPAAGDINWFAGRSAGQVSTMILPQAANRPRRRDPNTSPDHSIGRSDGRCVQRAGTQIAPPTKNGHAPPPIESRKSSQSVNPYYVWTCAGGTTRPVKARSASPAEGTRRPVHTARRTGRPNPRSNYELFNCNNLNIRYWSWNYRGCWHQTCPPMDPR